MKNGQGVYWWADGRKYIGGFQNNKMHGIGFMADDNSKVKMGLWQDGKRLHWLHQDIEESNSLSARTKEVLYLITAAKFECNHQGKQYNKMDNEILLTIMD